MVLGAVSVPVVASFGPINHMQMAWFRLLQLLLWVLLLSSGGRAVAMTSSDVAVSPERLSGSGTTPKALAEKVIIAAPGRFESLVAAAEHYASLPARGWQALASGPVLYPGQRHRQVEGLRRMLSLYGDYQRPSRGRIELALFDDQLAQALINFQRRHGLSADAVLGAQSREALNVTPAQRVFQLLVNHERQLALRQQQSERYVQVNLPEYLLRFYQDQQPVLEMRAIIGRRSRSTPTLASQIESMVLNPAWNIPRSIASQDILPKWQADSSYLARHNMKIVAGWGDQKVWVDSAVTTPDQLYRGKRYLRLYQLPGQTNALGQIKFNSPNDEAIYLHDTPSKSLFRHQQRAFSSGCVRLEQPALLAQQLLQSQSLAQPLLNMLDDDDTRWIKLQQPVDLFLTYWTAWPDPKLGVQFRRDIYQRDLPSAELLDAGRPVLKRSALMASVSQGAPMVSQLAMNLGI